MYELKSLSFCLLVESSKTNKQTKTRPGSGRRSSLMGKRILQVVQLPQGTQSHAKSTAGASADTTAKSHRIHTWLPGPIPTVWEQYSGQVGNESSAGQIDVDLHFYSKCNIFIQKFARETLEEIIIPILCDNIFQ